MEMPFNPNENTVPQFLSGGGEMGKLIRSFDWSKTPLGSPDTWPQSLRTTVSLCIASNFPISIAWGPHRVQIYNDGYWPICGDKHPTALGQDYKECWLSAWPVIGQAYEEAAMGQTRFLENQRMFLDRYGYLEETFFTFSFSPILDESGGVGGLFHPVTELTQQTLAERRLNILRAVADHTVNAKTPAEASSLILNCLKDFELDLPFVLLYSVSDNSGEAILDGSVGVEADSPLAPAVIKLLVKQPGGWPLNEVIQKGKAVQVDELAKVFGTFNCGPYPEAPKQALVFPLTLHGTDHNSYFLVIGISARRSLDEKYLLFCELLTGSVSNALTKARAHDEEKKKAEALAAIDKAKTTFFSNISHEFRTPLTLMLGSLEALLGNPVSEMPIADKDAIDIAHRNAMRLLKLVNNLLDFSRIEAGRVQVQYQLTDIAKYTADLASNFRSVVENAGLSFQVNIAPISEPIYMDKEMWEKIVFNLLSNAFKYTLLGSITLSLDIEENQLILRVKDTGVGIPENELPKMFQRFHRVQNVVGRTYEGTGIGLSLVSELVKLHGGEITVESKEAEGSVFTVSIPTGSTHLPAALVIEKEIDPMALAFKASLSDAFIEEAIMLVEQPAITNKASTASVAKSNSITVLVVDDNADMRAYLSTMLQKYYHVVTANNGLEALQKVNAQIPQLIVSDIMMPVMDGIQLLKALKENVRTQHLPVILLSARAGEESKIEGYDTGADDYLVKPFSAKELLARVAANLNLAEKRVKAEKHLYNLLMQSPVAIAILQGADFIVELANDKILEFYGKRRDEIINQPIFKVFPELAAQGMEDLYRKVYETGERVVAKEQQQEFYKNGQLYSGFFNTVFEPFRDVNGNITGLIVTGQQVTEEVNARRKLAASEAQFQAAIAAVEGIIWTNNANGEMEGEQLGWGNLTNQSYEEYKGYGWAKAIHPEDAQPTIDAWNVAVASRTTFVFEHRVKTTSGEWRLFSVKAIPVFDRDKNILQWVGVHTDITAQRQAAQKIIESEQRFRAIADESPMFVFIIEPDSQAPVSYWNKTWLSYTGQTSEEAIGRSWNGIIHPDDLAVVMDFFIPAFTNKEPYFMPAVRTKRHDGVNRWHAFKGNPRFTATGEFNGYMGVGFDVHEQKLSEEKLAYRTALLEAHHQASVDGILLVDGKGKIISYNNRFVEIWNIPPHITAAKDDNAALSFAMEQLLHPQQFIDRVKYLYEHPTAACHDELEYKDGRIVERNGYPVIGEDGTYYAWSWTFKDITRQKQIEKEIKASEEKFRTLANSLPQMAWMADAEGWIYWYNQRWYNYTGTTLEEMQGWGWQAVHHPDLVEGVTRDFTNAIAKGAPYDDTLLLRSKEGDYRWFLTRAVPIRNERGEIVQWFGTNTDVSAQRETQQALKDANEKLELTFKNVPSAIYHFNKEGKILYLNEIGARQIGYATVADVLAEQDVFRLRKKLDETFIVLDQNGAPLPAGESSAAISFKTGRPSEVVAHFINRQTGASCWFLSKSSPLFDEQGKLSIVLTTSTDITLQKTTEQVIRQSEEHFRTLSETLPQLVWMTDDKGNYEYASSQWLAYSGLDPLDSNSWPVLVYADDMEPLLKAWNQSLLSGQIYHAEARLKSKEGEYRWHFVRGEPVRDESGKIQKWIGAFTDIHEQKTITEKLEKLVAKRTKELRRSNEDLQQFAHVTSHDLKEPVRKIRIFNNLLRQEFKTVLPEKAGVYTSKIESAAVRLTNMIDGVLLYSSLDGQVLPGEKIDLNEVIRNIEEDLELLIVQKKALFFYQDLPSVEGSSVLIYQLFYNLINNSLKFSRADVAPVIKITSGAVQVPGITKNVLKEQEKHYTKLTISDNGIGFHPDEAERIFSTFSRLHSKDEYEGTGLGLALCKKIAERHGGAISAKGVVNEGSSFEIILPVCQP